MQSQSARGSGSFVVQSMIKLISTQDAIHKYVWVYILVLAVYTQYCVLYVKHGKNVT